MKVKNTYYDKNKRNGPILLTHIENNKKKGKNGKNPQI